MPDTLCPACSFPVQQRHRFCPSCGIALSVPTEDEERNASRERVQKAVGSAFEVGVLIGRGGFAEVFEARDRQLDRRVAVKVIRPDLEPSAELLERFQREARAMAAVRHPNIVEVYAVGAGDGIAWFAMPRIEGESLRDLLDRERLLPIAEARRILVESARALAAAHRAGLAHRDVKPDNILLDGPERRVLLTDFGIVKALGEAESALTGSGMLVGTPQYMSPEQAAGDPVDHRTDVYSLGVVAYRMIAGCLPFDAGTTQAVLARILTQVPRPLWELRSDCPDDLVAVVGRALAKDPGERWGDLAEALEVLEGRKAAAPLGSRIGMDGWDRSAPSGTPPQGSGHPETAAEPRRFRRHAAVLAVAWAAVATADAVVGLAGSSAWVGVALLGYLAVRASRLWAGGHDWRELLIPGAVPGTSGRAAQPGTLDTAEGDFGRHGSLVRASVKARAAILKAYAGMPHSEQMRLPALQETVERVAGRVKHLARKVVTLEERMADASTRLESLDAGPEATTDSHVMARAQAKVRELAAAREGAGVELRRCAAILQDVEDAITVLWRDDPARGSAEVTRALAAVRQEVEG